ncbi:hypothetical protein D6D27_06543, partial [Aureobasidium pullulans]
DQRSVPQSHTDIWATRSAQHRQARSLDLAIEHWSKLELKPTTRTATFMLSSEYFYKRLVVGGRHHQEWHFVMQSWNRAHWTLKLCSVDRELCRTECSNSRVFGKVYHHRDLRNRSNTTNRHSRSRHTSALKQQNCKSWDDQ